MTDLDELPVRLYETHIGELVRSGGRALLRWSDEAEERWGLNSSVLSRGLRVGLTSSDATESFFGALLPEGNHLETLAAEVKTVSNDLVGILGAVGADLAGALIVGSPSAARDPEKLTSEQIGELLRRASGFLVGGGGSALPGFQRKLTLSRIGGEWFRGNGSAPSTHILKPVDPDHRSAADAEMYTLHLAGALGLAPFESWVEIIADRPTLVIERYDREVVQGRLERIHQEDAGQALGLPWGGNHKFEQHNEGTTLRAISTILDTRGAALRGTPDRLKLLKYTAFNVAVGNTDAHAKNFSLLHSVDGGTKLAPLYDAAPLALDYANGSGMAMRINGKFQVPDITSVDLIEEAVSWGVSRDEASATVTSTLEALIAATRNIPAPDSIERHVPGYIRAQAQNLVDGKPARIESAIPLMALPRLGSPQPR
jgi:serine/threonine-protein kinase HipA